MKDTVHATIDDIQADAQERAKKAVDDIRAQIPGNVKAAGDRLTAGAQAGLSLAGDKLKNAASNAASSSIVDTATKLGAGVGGIAGAGVGYAVTSKDDDKKR